MDYFLLEKGRSGATSTNIQSATFNLQFSADPDQVKEFKFGAMRLHQQGG
jgi:hypothetical protein